MTARHLEYQRVAELVPAMVNPKGHDPEAIARSISRFGFTDPVIVDERTGRLVGGHGRAAMLADAEAAGLEPPDGITVGPDGWELPVVRGWSSRDDAEAHALGVALNQTTLAGGFDYQALADLLQSINADDTELVAALGFPDHDLAVLLAATQSTWAPPDPEGDLADFTRDPHLHQLRLTPGEYEVVADAVAVCRDRSNEPGLGEGAAVALMCRAYLDAR